MRAILFTLILCVGGHGFLYGQKDTILLLTGKTIIADVSGVSKTSVSYNSFFKDNGKQVFKSGSVEGYRVFSVVDDGEKTILYEQDSLVGNLRTVPEMKSFILGEQHADKYYNTKPFFYGGIGLGIGSVLYDTYLFKADANPGQKTGFFRGDPGLFPLLTTFVYPIAIGIPKVKLRTKYVNDKALLLDDDFLDGYERTARSSKVMRGLKGKAIGIGIGFLTYLAFQL